MNIIVAEMHFGTGWALTFALIGALHLLLIWHWLAVRFQRRRILKATICITANVALAAAFLVYFTGFFGGRSAEPYMRPLSYVAGFYLCMFFYMAGVFFFWDVSRLVRWTAVKIHRLLSGVAVGVADGAKSRGSESAPDGNDAKDQGSKDEMERGRPHETAGLHRMIRPVYSAKSTLVAVLICTIMSACAFYAPFHIKATHYDVEINRRGSDLEHMKAVMIADSHIGAAVRENQIDDIVRLTMNANPDVIFLAGDIFDEGTPESLKEYASTRFSQMKAKYGVYFVLGNHDAYRGDTEEVLGYMKRAGIICLLDDVTLAGSSFYVAGRIDRSIGRAPLTALEARMTQDLPVVLIDHQPSVGESAESGKIQLQFSGHTHDGQIFPFHIFDPISRALTYGLYRRGAEQIIVSSGCGEFAVPVRFGSPAEIVAVDISLK
ncbi:MAG: metallophosphoesterase [Clostridiales Family XIII bacterium]|jgi:predicted MPP superfamily phosphohydrolase|nr:metallophosphoesterase [Clostridiales Family XIII bacterium]